MPLLDCRGLVKDYPGKRAVDGVDYTVERGEIVGLLGPNGAGEAATVRRLRSVVLPDSGKSRVLGSEDPRAVKDRLGYLPEEKGMCRYCELWFHRKGLGPHQKAGGRQWREKHGGGEFADPGPLGAAHPPWGCRL